MRKQRWDNGEKWKMQGRLLAAVVSLAVLCAGAVHGLSNPVDAAGRREKTSETARKTDEGAKAYGRAAAKGTDGAGSGMAKDAGAAGRKKGKSSEAVEAAAMIERRVQSHIEEILSEEAAIVPGEYPVMGESSIKVSQMVQYYHANNQTYPGEVLGNGGAPDVETFCSIFYEEACAEGVRPEVAFAQTMKETGFLNFGGDVDVTQYNFAGLGTTGGGVPGNQFPDVRTGVRAQIQHLKAYATEEGLANPCVDERYGYVAKGSAPYVEWLGQKENPAGLGWATGLNYGYDIVEMIKDMRTYK